MHQEITYMSIIIVRNLLLVTFKPSTTYLSFPGAPTPRSIKVLYQWDNIDNKYNAVVYMYFSAHPYLLSGIYCFVINKFLLCNSSMIYLLCAAVVLTSCLVSFDKNEQHNSWRETASDVNDEFAWFEALKWCNAIPSMDTDRLPP